MSLVYTTTYNALVDKIVSHILSIVDNIDSAKFANIEDCFKDGYYYEKKVEGSKRGTTIYIARGGDGHGAINDCRPRSGGPHIGGPNNLGLKVTNTLKPYTVTFKISNSINPILKQSNTVKTDLVAWLNRFNFPFQLSDRITTNGLELITKLVLHFCIYKIRYVISPHSDNYYFEYISDSVNDTAIANVTSYECLNEIIKANDTKDLLQYIRDNIKNHLKYKSIVYIYSHEKKVGNKVISNYNYAERTDFNEDEKVHYNDNEIMTLDEFKKTEAYTKLTTSEERAAAIKAHLAAIANRESTKRQKPEGDE